jgi:serine/threonine-protein kinase
MELHDGPLLKRDDTPVPFVNAARGKHPASLGKAVRPAGAPAAGVAGRPSKREIDPHIGKVLGGCQLTERIARGGMGVVYRAKQLNLGRVVAVKVLSDELASDATFVRRFVQEARSAAQLSHGNVVHVNDVGECQGIFYFVMEYVDGQNLREILRDQAQLPIPRALEITLQVCHALRHAHQKGIIHRDIKPENIMLTRDGVVKLADLGLAKRTATDNSANLTMAGAVLGTPYYMAPEQAKDFSKVDHRSDIYSLGVTLYRMITGKVPFDGRSPIEVMIKAMDGKRILVPELRDDVPDEVVRIIDRMMHKNPDKRYQSVVDLLKDLAPVVHSKAAVEAS